MGSRRGGGWTTTRRMTMTETTTIEVPGYKAGTWVLDPSHSEVTFSVRHMMISKVRGTFGVKSATITAPENPLAASLTATVDVASINTGDEGRDTHLRSGDFFDVETYPTIDFVSTGVRYDGGDFLVDGDLTVRGVTKPVTFEVEFGVTWNAALETGGVLVGKDVTITLDLQGSLQQ